MEKLIAKLAEYGIDISLFGKGTAKSLEHLLTEIESGETELVERAGQLVRRVTVLGINVFCDRGGVRLRLKEDRQVFADGRVRRRTMPTSISEKLHKGEDPLEAVARALAEELGIAKFAMLTPLQPKSVVEESPSYPGLLSEYSSYEVDILIDPSEYKQEYREIQPDKTNYFVWSQ